MLSYPTIATAGRGHYDKPSVRSETALLVDVPAALAHDVSWRA